MRYIPQSLFSFFFACFISCFFYSCSKSPSQSSKVQQQDPEPATLSGPVRLSADTRFRLVHTKLELFPDWNTKTMDGKATLWLQPHFYSQDSVSIDAKYMDIHEVKCLSPDSVVLAVQYDSLKLNIRFNQKIQRDQTLRLYIKYTAKPEQVKGKGGEYIKNAKGLYFIVPDSLDPAKPIQLWTQGEPQAASCWFPTLDSPNQRTTQEIFISVPDTFTTLSNGIKMYSRKGYNGYRTDYWKMDLPHAPYLFVVAAGKFAEVSDGWRGIPVNYYVEPAFKNHAKSTFGRTPEMMEYFSTLLGIDFPWPKYSSIVVRDYVSGAMENTSATIFYDALQKTHREALDSDLDYIVAHELFHHWFGDLVTCESWSHLALNESFANYSEFLWAEHKFGSEEAHRRRLNDMSQYFDEAESKVMPIIRYRYHDPNDMFDSHSYSKGACVLHMLRREVGDEAFFNALHKYLSTYKFKSVEVHHLRLVFEEVTGRDLTPFFNTWFMQPGHPVLHVSDTLIQGQLLVTIQQQQKEEYISPYPLCLDLVYVVDGKTFVKKLVISQKIQSFSVEVAGTLQVVVLDPEHHVLADVIHQKSDVELAFQYRLLPYYAARQEALEVLSSGAIDSKNIPLLLDALKDKHWYLRKLAAKGLCKYKGSDTSMVRSRLLKFSETETNTEVLGEIFSQLAGQKLAAFKSVYEMHLSDSSYAVSSNALRAYLNLRPKDSRQQIDKVLSTTNAEVAEALAAHFVDVADTSRLPWFISKIFQIKREESYGFIQEYGRFLLHIDLRDGTKLKACTQPLLVLASSGPDWIRYSAFMSLALFDEYPYIKNKMIDIRSKTPEGRLRMAMTNILKD